MQPKVFLQMKTLLFFLMFTACSACAVAQESEQHPIDKALDQCEDKKQGTMGEAECLSDAFTSWEKDIADTYGALKRLVTRAELQTLQAGQKSWEAYRNHEFAFIAAMLNQKRGTMYIPIRLEYRIAVLKARALELERYMGRLKRLNGTE